MTCEEVALAARLLVFKWHALCSILFRPLLYLEEICHAVAFSGEVDFFKELTARKFQSESRPIAHVV
jgi:hypothetical protein